MRLFIIGNACAIIKLKGEIIIMRRQAEAEVNRVFRFDERFQGEAFIRADKIGRGLIG